MESAYADWIVMIAMLALFATAGFALGLGYGSPQKPPKRPVADYLSEVHIVFPKSAAKYAENRDEASLRRSAWEAAKVSLADLRRAWESALRLAETAGDTEAIDTLRFGESIMSDVEHDLSVLLFGLARDPDAREAALRRLGLPDDHRGFIRPGDR